MKTYRALLCLTLLSPSLSAQRELQDIAEPDLEKELAAFKVADGFEINLFAATPLIAKPTQISFDSDGRLWVAGSRIYPQLSVNENPSDQIVILEDSDYDGVADKTSVFYDKLLIPGGVLPDGEGGAYVAEGNELLHLHDRNGDGRADDKEVLLSGFGTEDTHHTLHRLSWGNDGKLQMLQGYYIGSHVETLYGPRRLNGGGLWTYDTDTRRLEIYSRGLVNPWGLAFDYWGQTFQTDGAGTEGIAHTFPDSVFLASPGESRILPGLLVNRPKHCGITIISGNHFPEAWQKQIITSDFRAHNVDRYSVVQDGSNYQAEVLEDLLSSSHKSFRPIDTVMGPDGALYIADWYNPIIQHGEVDFRDTRRDHIHGRIWRITSKGSPLIKKPDYSNASITELLELLKSEANWERLFAKQNLKLRKRSSVISNLNKWVSELDSDDSAYEHHILEALWTLQTLGASDEALLTAAAQSRSHNARAAAIRILYSDHSKIPSALTILKQAVKDTHPLVRREAISSLGQMASLDAFVTLMGAYSGKLETLNEFALWRSCRLLEPHWIPALQAGDLKVDSNALMFALKATESEDAAKMLLKLFTANREQADPSILVSIGQSGNTEELNFLTRIISEPDRKFHHPAAEGLMIAAQQRSAYPSERTDSALQQLLKTKNARMQVIACTLAGFWKTEAVLEQIKSLLIAVDTNDAVRSAAANTMQSFDSPSTRQFLNQATGEQYDTYTRALAATALTQIDVDAGAQTIAGLFTGDFNKHTVEHAIEKIIRKEGAFDALAVYIAGKTIPAETATHASRIVQSSGRAGSDELLKALAKAGSLKTPEKLNINLKIIDLMAKLEQGDAARGKEVYHRPELTCVACHKINGDGLSDIGPDLGSIGASAPLDYLIESLLAPSKKIKEGYRSSSIITKDGSFYAGSIENENDNTVFMKSAADETLTVQKSTIKSRETSKTSMMPAGLTDSLSEAELIDLIQYLNQLGKNE